MKTFTYLWQWQLKSSPTELWPYVADTERFNRAAGQPAADFTEIPRETGGSQRIARMTKFGLTVEYEDHPFEWIRAQEFSNVRVFKYGPIAKTKMHTILTPNAQGTQLHYQIEVTPANLMGWLGIPVQFGWEMRRNFERVFRQIDDAVQNQTDRPFALKKTPLNPVATSRLAEMFEQLLHQGHKQMWVQKLIDLLRDEPDIDLARLRPYHLADGWGAPRLEILELFLSAAKLGLLNLRWDILCPRCRGVPLGAGSLDGVRQGVHCDTCNINFQSDLSRNVELTFAPHPQIREVNQPFYCIGGPMVTPHIKVHQLLQAGETRTIVVRQPLPGGAYRIRSQQQGVNQQLKLGDAATPPQGTLTCRMDAGVIAGQFQADSPPADADNEKAPLTITLANDAPYPQQFFLEQAKWYTDAATADQVTALQHFRDLFSDEVLRPGEEIGVQGMTILFSDLVGSTAMYNQKGDASSYALVREQFAFLQRIIRVNEGAIVKTIGDAIMAVFSKPTNGVRAALAIQTEIARFNRDNSSNLIIKLGLHYGPCIAVTLNDRLDYFGTTVNMAARLESLSQGGDVVISERLRQDPPIAALLDEQAVEIVPFQASVKGFSQPLQIYRLKPGAVAESLPAAEAVSHS